MRRGRYFCQAPEEVRPPVLLTVQESKPTPSVRDLISDRVSVSSSKGHRRQRTALPSPSQGGPLPHPAPCRPCGKGAAASPLSLRRSSPALCLPGVPVSPCRCEPPHKWLCRNRLCCVLRVVFVCFHTGSQRGSGKALDFN